ncbi:hypothetical protein [Spiroplasma cantharicola]|uniref:hypothetical protein n=1 Tax=Spiroplasma cantharicola TaxID=362837 RepID=UPI001F48CC7E|nr:hypothetical protein [Spiroplasma cantharicola]
MEVNGRETPLYSLVWGMPYVSTALNEDKGWFIGMSTMGDELFLNPHLRNE